MTTLVFERARPARIDSYAGSSGPFAFAARERGVRSSVGTPILVEGRLWGVMIVGSMLSRPLPADTEARLASFTELVATAIANAESPAGLARLAAEQSALRRVATLVARGVPPEEMFSAVAQEVGLLLGRVRDPEPLRGRRYGQRPRFLEQDGRPFPPVGTRVASRPMRESPSRGRVRDPGGGIGIALHPGRTVGLEHDRHEVLPPKDHPGANRREGVARPAPGSGVADRTVGLEAAQDRELDRKQQADLLGDRREHLLWRHPPRHQRRDPPQRRLLRGQPREAGAALGVRDRRRHQLRERSKPRLGVGWQWLLQVGRGHYDAPQAALDEDRRSNRRADAHLVNGGTRVSAWRSARLLSCL
ncbi:MAG TPA: GAF domain-containing protein [Solirubrobacteraceae bacterium]|nr:GAF domain-containing protein [Solirubrobacteraceae bacterium]